MRLLVKKKGKVQAKTRAPSSVLYAHSMIHLYLSFSSSLFFFFLILFAVMHCRFSVLVTKLTPFKVTLFLNNAFFFHL